MAAVSAWDALPSPEPRISPPHPPLPPTSVSTAAPAAVQMTHPVRIVGVGQLIRVFGHRDQRVAAIAEVQRGVVSRAQLRQAALSHDAIDRMAAKGRLHRIFRGVFAVGHRELPPWALETAALLAVGPEAVLSHLSAGALWGLLPALQPDDGVDVLRSGPRMQRRGIRVHRTSRVEPRDVRVRDGLPVTSPARTLLDLAEVVPIRRLERALDEAIVQRLVRPAQVEDALARASGRHGAPKLAAVLGTAGRTRTRSEAEERLLALIRQAEIPAPETNARIGGFEVDFLWRDQGLVLELDGYRFHSTRSAFERDRRKGAVLTAGGLRVMHATWLQAEHEGIALVVRLAQALHARPGGDPGPAN